MSNRSLKSKRPSKAVSPALASGASASIGEATTNIPPTSQSHEIFLGEEEISDVSLATFYVLDKENAGAIQLGNGLRFNRRGYGCGCCGGGGGGGCATSCASCGRSCRV
jgi:hypothetical protein